MEKAIYEKLLKLKNEYDEIVVKLNNSDISSNPKAFIELQKQQAKIEPKVSLFNKYTDNENTVADLQKQIETESDKEMLSMLYDELNAKKDELAKLDIEIKEELIEKDPLDSKEAIFEIKGAVGGDEGKLFAADLFWMYQKYCSKNGFNVKVLDSDASEHGGYAYITFEVTAGRGAKDPYGKFKYESGVHRVQRVPATEALGRVHTSTATVLVLPKAEEVDVKINPADIKRDTYRAGGAGGQHVNKTDSAVRLTHIPTGIVAASQEGKSQHANHDIAMEMLRSKLFEFEVQKKQEAENKTRRLATGSGERSEKIRTYNYPDNRVTDHRIGLTLKKLDRIMDGSALGELLDVLVATGYEQPEN